MHNYTFNIWLYSKITNRFDYLKVLDELSLSQWLNYDLIQEYKIFNIRKICEYAYKNTLYYNKLFTGIGLKEFDDIKSIEDIKQIPILTKDIVRSSLNELSITQKKDLILYQTGGSTGMPLQFFMNKDFFYKQKLGSNLRAYSHSGYKFGQKIGLIWGFDNDIPKRNWMGTLFNRLTLNTYELNSFKLTSDSIISFIELLNKHKIKYLKGYASSLYEVAEFIIKNDIKIDYNIKAIYSEAEILEEFKRSKIIQAFGSKVYNYYGSREFGTIAVECSHHNGMHINYEQLNVEIDKDSNILVTSFLNLGTPFIRYKIGDCADKIITEKCSCGRYSERIQTIYGRESDNFITSNGKIIHGEYFTHLFYNTKSILKFQIIQNAPSLFELKIISTDIDMSRKELTEIIKKMEYHFEYPIEIEIDFVNEIPKTRTGKNKFTIRNF